MPTLLQSKSATAWPSATCTVVLDNPITQGSLLVISVIGGDINNQVLSVTDNNGVVLSRVVAEGFPQTISGWYRNHSLGNEISFTATFGPNQAIGISVLEYADEGYLFDQGGGWIGNYAPHGNDPMGNPNILAAGIGPSNFGDSIYISIVGYSNYVGYNPYNYDTQEDEPVIPVNREFLQLQQGIPFPDIGIMMLTADQYFSSPGVNWLKWQTSAGGNIHVIGAVFSRPLVKPIGFTKQYSLRPQIGVVIGSGGWPQYCIGSLPYMPKLGAQLLVCGMDQDMFCDSCSDVYGNIYNKILDTHTTGSSFATVWKTIVQHLPSEGVFRITVTTPAQGQPLHGGPTIAIFSADDGKEPIQVTGYKQTITNGDGTKTIQSFPLTTGEASYAVVFGLDAGEASLNEDINFQATNGFDLLEQWKYAQLPNDFTPNRPNLGQLLICEKLISDPNITDMGEFIDDSGFSPIIAFALVPISPIEVIVNPPPASGSTAVQGQGLAIECCCDPFSLMTSKAFDPKPPKVKYPDADFCNIISQYRLGAPPLMRNKPMHPGEHYDLSLSTRGTQIVHRAGLGYIQVANPAYRESVVKTDPGDNYKSTADTIAQMRILVYECLRTKIVHQTAQSIYSGIRKHRPDEEDIIREVFWWIRRNIQFKGDEELLESNYGVTPEAIMKAGGMELLISPSLLLQMDNPSGDCDDFSTLNATLLKCMGIARVCFCTIAADRMFPENFSHVYNKAMLSNGEVMPLDVSHGQHPGWETKDKYRELDWWI